jgi:UDP-glucose 4-epimerase
VLDIVSNSKKQNFRYALIVKTLVTGGCGFIGSHLVDHLLIKGEQVIVLDNSYGSNLNHLRKSHLAKSIEIVDGSILNKRLVKKLMGKVSNCYHLAASLGVEKINNQPLIALEVNLQGTENVLYQASKFGVRTLLASSSEIYGKNSVMPLSESSDRVLGSPEVARWSYSEAKALDELFAFELCKHESFPVTIARFFNTVGPRQSGVYGMVLPRFVRSAIGNEPLTVYGDGTQTRSFCSVTDVVVAIDLLMASNKSIGHAFNIGSPNEISIVDLAKKVINLTKSDSKILYKKHFEVFGDNFEEPQRRVPDISKISKIVGWQPKKSLDEVILEVANSMVN